MSSLVRKYENSTFFSAVAKFYPFNINLEGQNVVLTIRKSCTWQLYVETCKCEIDNRLASAGTESFASRNIYNKSNNNNN